MGRPISNRRLVTRCRTARREAASNASTVLLYVAIVGRAEAEGFDLTREQHTIIMREAERDLLIERYRRQRITGAAGVIALYAWAATGVVWAAFDLLDKGIIVLPK